MKPIKSKVPNTKTVIGVCTTCWKQRKQTECVPGSEKIVTTKNGRKMMKCKCAECGITKTKFVKNQGN